MSYQLHITSTAEHDIMRAVDYIEFTLKNPQAADNLLDAVTKQIGTLSDFPQKFRLVDDPVLASWEIRFVIINNYLAFYTIDEEKQTVIVVRFLYQKSNWCSILRHNYPVVCSICIDFKFPKLDTAFFDQTLREQYSCRKCICLPFFPIIDLSASLCIRFVIMYSG